MSGRMLARALAACAALAIAGTAGAAHRTAAQPGLRELRLARASAGAPARPVKAPPRPERFVLRWSRQKHPARLLAASRGVPADEVVAGLGRGVTAGEVATRYGLRVVSADRRIRTALLAGSSESLRRIAAAVGSDAQLRYVERDRVLEPAHRRADPATVQVDATTGVPYEWPFAAVGVDRALNLTKGSSEILVGVVDTGVSQVRDLAGKIAYAWYFSSETSSVEDTEGHGTFVSSIIAGTNDDNFGLAGFCGACRLDVFKSVRTTDYTLAISVRRLVDDHVHIINLSLGRSGGASSVLADALNYAIAQGVLVVAATGNDGVGNVSWPAWWLQPSNGGAGYGLAVGASDATGARAYFSNWGTNLSLLAPGSYNSSCSVGIWAALPPVSTDFDSPRSCARTFADASGARYGYASGTSFSAPEVAGIAALVWAARPELKNYEVANILRQSATRPAGAGWQSDRGWGLVDAARALELATGRSAADAVLVGTPRASSLRAGRSTTVRAAATWQDGVALNEGTASCKASAGGRAVASVAGALAAGTASCAFPLPAWTAGRRLSVTVAVTDASGVGAERSATFKVRK